MESPKRDCDLGALRSKTLAFKKRTAIIFCNLKNSLSARGLGRLRSKNAAFCVCVSKPAKLRSVH